MVESRIHALKATAARRGQTLRGAFIEINDPAKVKAEHDSIDPAVRAAIFERLGARRIPVDYVQPALSAETAPCDYLMLMSYPIDGHYADKPAIDGIVRGIYAHYQPAMDLPNSAFYQRFRRQLDSWTPDLPAGPVRPGYAEGLPPHRKSEGVSPLESIRFFFADFKLAVSRRLGSTPKAEPAPKR